MLKKSKQNHFNKQTITTKISLKENDELRFFMANSYMGVQGGKASNIHLPHE